MDMVAISVFFDEIHVKVMMIALSGFTRTRESGRCRADAPELQVLGHTAESCSEHMSVGFYILFCLWRGRMVCDSRQKNLVTRWHKLDILRS